MKLPTQRTPFFMGAAAALMLVFSTAAVYPSVAQTGDATPTPGAATPAAPNSDQGTDSSTGSSTGSSKALGRHGISGASDDRLAEALGISTDDLQAAYLKAANAALDQAVAQDLLTQTQADNLRQRLESANGSGFGFHLGGRGLNLFGADEIDGEALLADALGISTDDLQAAYDKAEAAALAQAVTDGRLTQDQADLVAARRALQEYWATQQQSYEEIVQAAVDAGAITQEQADLLIANQPSNGHGFGLGGLDFGPGMGDDFGGRGMDGGRGMNGGRGMMPGMPGMPGMDGGRGGFGHGMHGVPGDQDSDDSQDSQQDDSGSQSDTSLVPNFGL